MSSLPIRKILPVWGKPIASQLAVFSILAFVGWALCSFDWGFPQVKLVGVPSLVLLTIWVSARLAPPPPEGVHKISVFLSVLTIAGLLSVYGWRYVPHALDYPHNDIGRTTQSATLDFWGKGINPYDRMDLNPRPELALRYRGFHYGPGMVLVYAPAAAIPSFGYRLMQVFWVFTALAALMYIAASMVQGGWGKLSSSLFALSCVFVFENWWKEFWMVGVNDPAPLALLFVSFAFMRRENWSLCGLFMGLSFACKFVPSLFALLPFVRGASPKKLWLGFFAGASLIIPFMAWSPLPSFNNIFVSRLAVAADPTSLFSLYPKPLHWVIASILPATIILAWVRNWRAGLDFGNIYRTYLAILCAGMLSHREIHANHLTWMLMSCSILLAVSRYELFDRIVARSSSPPFPPRINWRC